MKQRVLLTFFILCILFQMGCSSSRQLLDTVSQIEPVAPFEDGFFYIANLDELHYMVGGESIMVSKTSFCNGLPYSMGASCDGSLIGPDPGPLFRDDKHLYLNGSELSEGGSLRRGALQYAMDGSSFEFLLLQWLSVGPLFYLSAEISWNDHRVWMYSLGSLMISIGLFWLARRRTYQNTI